jgi:hypothetical protein
MDVKYCLGISNLCVNEQSVFIRDENNFPKIYRSDLKIVGATVQNLVSTTTWRPGFVHPWADFSKVSLYTPQRRMRGCIHSTTRS